MRGMTSKGSQPFYSQFFFRFSPRPVLFHTFLLPPSPPPPELIYNKIVSTFFNLKAFGEEHLETALSLENMALVKMALKDWDEAHYYFNKAG